MNRVLAVMLLACASASVHAEDVIIVGELVSVRSGPCEKDSALDGECSQKFIAIYRAAYIVGSSPELDRVFEVKVHERDLTAATDHRYTLLSLSDEGEERYSLYGAIPVHPMNDGRFAQCGCPPAIEERYEEKKRLRKQCTGITFAPAITEDLTNASAYRREVLAETGYRVRGNQATCVRGVDVEGLIRALK